MVSSAAPVAIFLLSPQLVSLVLGKGKSQRQPCPVNTVVEACLRFYFWPKTYAQASICELVRYHNAKSRIGFSTILCVSEELLRSIEA